MEQHPDSPAPFAAAYPPFPLDFEPVPLRRRRDGWTPERQRRYVEALARWGSGSRAAACVGLSQQSAARLRCRPGAASFNRACEAAWRIGKRRRRAAAASDARAGTEVFSPREAETYGTTETSDACLKLPAWLDRASQPLAMTGRSP